VLEGLTGWQKRAWLEGDWDIAAGQYFTTFRRDVHVVEDFDDTRAVEWFAALDYGFAHYTVALLGCRDGDRNTYIVDEHAERLWLPQRHGIAIRAMVGNLSNEACEQAQSVLRALAGGRHLHQLGIKLAEHGHEIALRFHDFADVFCKPSALRPGRN
jgi:hypothetical protein